MNISLVSRSLSNQQGEDFRRLEFCKFYGDARDFFDFFCIECARVYLSRSFLLADLGYFLCV
jgi:hypothetical protein